MELLHFFLDHGTVLTASVLGGCVATMAVPKPPMYVQLITNILCGMFCTILLILWYADDEGKISRRTVALILGVSVLGAPIIERFIAMVKDPEYAIMIWNKFKGKK